MGKPVKIQYKASLELIFEEFVYTRARLKRDKSARVLVPEFEVFLPKFWTILQQEFNLRAAIVEAFANIIGRDEDLNEVSDVVIKAILSLCEKGFKDLLYQHYCGDKRPYEFKRPILGEQLEAVRRWLNSLRDPHTHPSLQALVDLVETAVLAADEAIEQRNGAQQENAAFREFGARKLLIDSFNELREAMYDRLEEIRKNTTDRKLPEEYAESFFQRSRARNSVEGKADIRTLEAEIEALEKDLEARKARLAELKAQEEVRRQQEAELSEALAAAAEAERLAVESKRRAEELRAKLSRKK